jgi:4-methylaminobutanoate oxidase (formaldehyde-forming)
MVESDEPVTQGYLDAGTWEIDIAGSRHRAVASIRPMYDPENARIRA